MNNALSTPSHPFGKQLSLLICILALCFGAAVLKTQAQSPAPLAPTGIYTGVQTNEGTYDPFSTMQWGNTFVLNSYGEWETHHLSVSVNYQTNQFNQLNDYAVTGGSWSLVVFQDGSYAGTLFGDVQRGAIQFTVDKLGAATSRQTQLSLQTTGGLGIYKGKKKINQRRTLEMNTDLLTRSNQTTGFLPVTF